MKIPSYEDKTYIVEDNDARIRSETNLTSFLKYKKGEKRPPGAEVGDFKRFPQHIEVKVTGVKTYGDRNVCVFAEPVKPKIKNIPSGWTRSSNLRGGFLNELVDFVPAEWDSVPSGKNFTVTDGKSLIRTGSPDFKSTGETIPVGTYVVVKETGEKGGKTFVKVRRAEISKGKIKAKEEIGWTSAANLTQGCTKFFGEADWKSQKGENACWQRGRYIGAKVLINIVGTGGQMEKITLDSLEAYMNLKDAAAKSNLDLAITSGFRSFSQQKNLFDLFKKGKGNLAAKPGSSNHQHGQAFDLNTGGFNTRMYKWLEKRAPKLGFVRTVRGEHWHWEYLPEKAATLAAAGRHKTFTGNR